MKFSRQAQKARYYFPIYFRQDEIFGKQTMQMAAAVTRGADKNYKNNSPFPQVGGIKMELLTKEN